VIWKKNQFEFVERQIKALGKPPNSKATHTHLVGQHTHTATTHTDAHEAAPANPPVKEPRCLRRRSLAAIGGTPRRRPRPAPPPAATRATTGRVAAPCLCHARRSRAGIAIAATAARQPFEALSAPSSGPLSHRKICFIQFQLQKALKVSLVFLPRI
jgi:hypothetical protein